MIIVDPIRLARLDDSAFYLHENNFHANVFGPVDSHLTKKLREKINTFILAYINVSVTC